MVSLGNTSPHESTGSRVLTKEVSKGSRAAKVGLAIGLLSLIAGLFVLVANQAGATVGERTEVFEVAIGEGQGQIQYVIQEESEPWGPISFTVLSSGDIAVLDSGNQRLLVLDREGNQLREIRYEEVGLVSPMDLVEWEDQLAVVESNTSPQTVVVIDLQTKKKTRIVPLPSALAEHRPKFILGNGEKLQLVEGGAIAHVVADKSGDLPVSAIAQDRNDLDIKGFSTVWSSPGVPKEGIAPTLARTQQVGTTQDVAVSLSGVPATWVEPIGKSRPGGLLLYTSYIVEGRGALTTRFYVEERSSETLQSQAYAAVPVDEFQVFPAKFIAVSSTGEIWCMVPKKDRVSFEQLTPAPGVPALWLADAALSVSGMIGSALDAVWAAVTPDVAHATGGVNSPWSRDDGDGTGYGYYSLNWYCNSEAYYRSCGTPGGDGDDGNGRPRYITSYNTYYQWAPYQWGGFDTAAAIRDHVGDSGNDAGDYTSGPTGSVVLGCPMGVDCSGFVSRLWGLQSQHTTISLTHHATTVSSYSNMLIGDIFDKTSGSRHCIWYRYNTANGANCYESTTWNSWDRVANSLRNPAELIAAGYGMYRSTTWN